MFSRTLRTKLCLEWSGLILHTEGNLALFLKIMLKNRLWQIYEESISPQVYRTVRATECQRLSFYGSLRHALEAFLVLVKVWTRGRVAILSQLIRLTLACLQLTLQLNFVRNISAGTILFYLYNYIQCRDFHLYLLRLHSSSCQFSHSNLAASTSGNAQCCNAL